MNIQARAYSIELGNDKKL